MNVHPECGRADLHVHSVWSDGAQRPDAIVRACAGRLDVVAITDHDEIQGALEARAFARERADLGVDVVVGEEISTLNGHLLGLYLEERVPPGLPAAETIGRIHAQGGLAVAAHPFHPLRGSVRGHPSIGELLPHLACLISTALSRFRELGRSKRPSNPAGVTHPTFIEFGEL
jgi:predicted metal-dependent phosphoesterase TrpH